MKKNAFIKNPFLKMVFAGMFLSNGLMFADSASGSKSSPGEKLDYRFTKLTEHAFYEKDVGVPSTLREELMKIRHEIDEKTMEDFGEQHAKTNPEASFIYEMGQRKVSIYYARCKNAGNGDFEALDRIDDKGFTALAPNLATRYGNEAAKYLVRMMMAISDKRYVMHLLGVEDLEGLKIKKTFYLETAVPYHYKLGGALEVYEKLNITYADQQKCDVLLSYTFANKSEMPVDLVRITYWGILENGRVVSCSNSGLILYQGELINPTDELEDQLTGERKGLKNAPALKRNAKEQQVPVSRRHHRRNAQYKNVNRNQMKAFANDQEVAPVKKDSQAYFGGNRNSRRWRKGYRGSSASKQNQVLMEAVDENGNQIWIIDNTPDREVAPQQPRHGIIHFKMSH